MFQSLRPAPTLLLCVLGLTGCGPGPAVLVRQDVPPALLTCQPAPEPPQPPFTDADLALWIVDLATAGDDCRSRLASVRGLVTRP